MNNRHQICVEGYLTVGYPTRTTAFSCMFFFFFPSLCLSNCNALFYAVCLAACLTKPPAFGRFCNARVLAALLVLASLCACFCVCLLYLGRGSCLCLCLVRLCCSALLFNLRKTRQRQLQSAASSVAWCLHWPVGVAPGIEIAGIDGGTN